MGLIDLFSALLFLSVTPAMFLMIGYAQLRKMSPAAIQKVNRFFRTAGTIWWWLSLALALFLAVQVKQQPELYAFTDQEINAHIDTRLNTTGFILPAGLEVKSTSLPPDFQKVTTWQDKIDNNKTYANVYRWLTGAVGWWLLLTFTLLAGRLRWTLMRLGQYEPQPPRKPSVLSKILDKFPKEPSEEGKV